MPANRPQRPVQVARLIPLDTDDSAEGRAVQSLQRAHDDLTKQVKPRATLVVNLVVGLNRVIHGLGRPYFGYTITPTIANAAFAHAISTTRNPHPDREVWIDVIGGAQPKAKVEVF